MEMETHLSSYDHHHTKVCNALVSQVFAQRMLVCQIMSQWVAKSQC